MKEKPIHPIAGFFLRQAQRYGQRVIAEGVDGAVDEFLDDIETIGGRAKEVRQRRKSRQVNRERQK
jgi:hypothetical protein